MYFIQLFSPWAAWWEAQQEESTCSSGSISCQVIWANALVLTHSDSELNPKPVWISPSPPPSPGVNGQRRVGTRTSPGNPLLFLKWLGRAGGTEVDRHHPAGFTASQVVLSEVHKSSPSPRGKINCITNPSAPCISTRHRSEISLSSYKA